MINRLNSFKKGARPEITILSARPMNEVNFTDKQPANVNQTATGSLPKNGPTSIENQPANNEPIIGIDIPPPPKTAPPPKPARKQRPTSEIYNGFSSLRSVKTAKVDVDSMKTESSKLGRSKSLYSSKKSSSSRDNPVRPAPPPPSYLHREKKALDRSSGSVSPVHAAPSLPFTSFNKKLPVERPHEDQTQKQAAKGKKKRSYSASNFNDKQKKDGVRRSASTLPRGKHTPEPATIVTELSDDFIILERRKSLDETPNGSVKLKSFGVKVSKSTSDVSNTVSASTVDMPTCGEVNKTENTAVVSSEIVQQSVFNMQLDSGSDNSKNSQNLGQEQTRISPDGIKEPVTLQDALNASAILARLKQVNESESESQKELNNIEVSDSMCKENNLVGQATATGIHQNINSNGLETVNLAKISDFSGNKPVCEPKNVIEGSQKPKQERNNNKDIAKSMSDKCLNHVISPTSNDIVVSSTSSFVVHAKTPVNSTVSSAVKQNGDHEGVTKVVTPTPVSHRSPKRPSPPSVKPKPKLSNGPSLGSRPWNSFDDGTSSSTPNKVDSGKVAGKSSPLIIKPGRSSAGKFVEDARSELKPEQYLPNNVDDIKSDERTVKTTTKEGIMNAPLIIKAGSFQSQKTIEAISERSKNESQLKKRLVGERDNSNTTECSEDTKNVNQRNMPLIIKANKSNKDVDRAIENDRKVKESNIVLEAIDLRSIETGKFVEGVNADCKVDVDAASKVKTNIETAMNQEMSEGVGETSKRVTPEKPARQVIRDQELEGSRSADRKKSESEAESTGSVDSLSSLSSQVTVIMNPSAVLQAIDTESKPTGVPFDSQEPKLRKKSLPEPYSSHRERRPKPGKQPPATLTLKSRNRKSRSIGGRRPQTSPPSTPPPPPKIHPNDKDASAKKTERPPVPPRAPSMLIQSDIRSLDALLKTDVESKNTVLASHKPPPPRPNKPTLLSRAATFEAGSSTNVGVSREFQTAVRDAEAIDNAKSDVSSKVEMFDKAAEKPKRPAVLWKQRSLDAKVDASESNEPTSVEQLRKEGKEALEVVSRLRENSTTGRKSGFTPKKPKRPLSFSMENFMINNLVQPSSDANIVVNQEKKKAPAKPSRPLSFVQATSMDGGVFALNFHGNKAGLADTEDTKSNHDYMSIEEVKKRMDETVSKEDAEGRNETRISARENDAATEEIDATSKGMDEKLLTGKEESQSNIGPKSPVGSDQRLKSAPKKPVRTSSLRKKKPVVLQKRTEKIGQTVTETDGVVPETDVVVSETDGVVSETDVVVSETDGVESGLDKKVDVRQEEDQKTSSDLSNQIEKLDEIITQTTVLKEKLFEINKDKILVMESPDKKGDICLQNGITETPLSADGGRTDSGSTSTSNPEKYEENSEKETGLSAEKSDLVAGNNEISERLEIKDENLDEKKSGREILDGSNTESRDSELVKSESKSGDSADSTEAVSTSSADENTESPEVGKSLVKETKCSDKSLSSANSSSEPSVDLIQKKSTKTPPAKPARPLSFPKVQNTEYLSAFLEHNRTKTENLTENRKQPPRRPTSLPPTEYRKRFSANEFKEPHIPKQESDKHGNEAAITSQQTKNETVTVAQQSPTRASRPPIPAVLRNVAESNMPTENDGLMGRLKKQMEITDPHCIALFDYTSDSDQDLNFKAGDLILLEKQVNREWFYGSLNDIKGMFPSSFVEVIIDVPFQEELTEESAIDDVLGHIDKPHALALYSFVAGNDDELTFESGDTIDLISWIDNEWFQGICKGRTGIFPANFVAVVKPLPDLEPLIEAKACGIDKEACNENEDFNGNKTHDSVYSEDLSGRLCKAVADFVSDVDGNLNFKAGQDIKIISCLGDDWLKGVLHDKTGIFPRSSVKILDKADPLEENLADVVAKEQTDVAAVKSCPDDILESTTQSDAQFCQSQESPKAKAIKDHDAHEDSELSFKVDDIIILKKRLEDGWIEGEMNNCTGRFHESYVEILVPL